MKYYEKYLLERGHSVNYIQSTEDNSDIRTLIRYLHSLGIESIALIDPVDDWLLKRIKSSCQKLKLDLRILESPMFLNSNEELVDFFKPSKKKFFQTEFYKQERIKRKILIDESGGPSGGQWTFDTENRKKFPKGKSVVKVEFPHTDRFIKEAHEYTRKYYPENVGSLSDAINYPIGFEASEQWLNQFLKKRLLEFGDYEDVTRCCGSPSPT